MYNYLPPKIQSGGLKFWVTKNLIILSHCFRYIKKRAFIPALAYKSHMIIRTMTLFILALSFTIMPKTKNRTFCSVQSRNQEYGREQGWDIIHT